MPARGLLVVCACLGATLTASASEAPPIPRPKPGEARAETVPLPRPKPRAMADTPEPPPGSSRPAALPPQFNPIEEPKPAASIDATNRCLMSLQASGVGVERARSYESKGHCLIDDPVLVRSIEGPAGKVDFPARPLLDCRFASALSSWIKGVVSPVAAQLMSSPVTTVETGPGYVCRNMNNGAVGKRSAHAIGNALDLVAFRLADGRRLKIENYDVATGMEKEFLAALRTSACGYFLTVLGPGSDAAHGNHLHVDLAQAGRSANYRICE